MKQTDQDITEKNPLLSLAKTDLDTAQEAYDTACRVYQHSHLHVDRQAMYAALNKLQFVKKNYELAYRLLTQHTFSGKV